MMNKYLVRIWVQERVHKLKDIWVEADSFSAIQNMNNQEFAESIYGFSDLIDQFSDGEGIWDIESIKLASEHPDNITPSDEKPDVEDIDSNAGRGK